jgi:hypothetical protein
MLYFISNRALLRYIVTQHEHGCLKVTIYSVPLRSDRSKFISSVQLSKLAPSRSLHISGQSTTERQVAGREVYNGSRSARIN